MYTSDSFDIFIRVGCAFLLYCLHGTQTCKPPHPVRLVEGLWDSLVRLRRAVRPHSEDAFAALERMRLQGSFEFCEVASKGPGVPVADKAAAAARSATLSAPLLCREVPHRSLLASLRPLPLVGAALPTTALPIF